MKKILLFFTLVLSLDFSSIAQWTQKADFIGSRTMAAGFSIGTKGYIGTGRERYGCGMKLPCEKDYNDFWEYNPTNNTWTKKADFGGDVRILAEGFSIGDKGYIGMGGRVDYKKDFWEYNPTTNIWTRKADFPGLARWAAVGFSIGNKGYVGLGQNGTTNFVDLWEYDPLTDSWTKKTDFPGVARSGVVYFSIGNRGYVGLGLSIELISDFWEYNPENNSWKRIADFPGSYRQVATGFSIGTKGYVVAGHNGLYLKDLWEWNSLTNTWAKKEDFGGSGRISAVGFSVGSKGYFGTGEDGFCEKDFWEYNAVITSSPLSFNNDGFAKVFPNPVNNRITIEYPKEFDVEIADINGRHINSYPRNKTNLIIDLNDYPKAIYLLKIISDHKIVVEKIIKQ
jgi:N-acetylneuraminic acid mutarotase